MRRHSRMKARVATTVLVALFAWSVTSGILQSREALRQREINAAATEFELAAHTLATIELIDAPPRNIEVERADAAAVLLDSMSFDRTSLDPTQRNRAEQLSFELTTNSRTGSTTPRANVDELISLFHEDATSADQYSRDAASTTLSRLIVSALSGIAIVALVLIGQRREKRLSRRLRKQATTDYLTGLPNRREIPIRLDDARIELKENGGCAALLFLDLDGFKSLNDALGHTAGDQVLRQAASRLHSEQREGETVIRVGGDEFAVVLTGIKSADEANEAARRYQAVLERQSDSTETQEPLRVSLGVAVTTSVDEVDDLHNQADIAMYVAKRRQGSRVEFFKEEMRSETNAATQLIRSLRSADYDAEFRLEFQPVVNVDADEAFFVEALLRWDSPTLGAVSPGDFIPAAEQTGEIIALGSWVFEQTCLQLREWRDDPAMADLSVSCNVSVHQLLDPDFMETLRSYANQPGFDPSQVIIEITESALPGPAIPELLHEVQSLGYRIAIDDFGSGYSNLAQLIHTPFDILKVDAGLSRSLGQFDTNSKDAVEILRAINTIAKSQNAPVVCEGIEHEHQRDALAKCDISHFQGWLISRSVPPEELVSVLRGLAPISDQLAA